MKRHHERYDELTYSLHLLHFWIHHWVCTRLSFSCTALRQWLNTAEILELGNSWPIWNSSNEQLWLRTPHWPGWVSQNDTANRFFQPILPSHSFSDFHPPAFQSESPCLLLLVSLCPSQAFSLISCTCNPILASASQKPVADKLGVVFKFRQKKMTPTTVTRMN